MQDPFYIKEKKRKPQSGMLAADAWLDSSLYEFWNALGRGYTRFQDFMSRFHVTGVKRFVVEILSDAFSFGAIGAVLMTALALPAFDITDRGAFNKAEDYSVIFQDRYGAEIGRRGIRSDDSVALDQMPDYLVKATLATEDRRFYEHFGIDVVGTLRALMSNAQGDRGTQGGSSITQQLAKNLFLSSERTLERKIVEAFLSVWLEWHYSKDQILKLYFDRAYMGGGNYGVTAASEFYFGKRVQDINLSEAAMLAGMFKAPGNYAPHIDLAAARGRANLVLTNMVAAGFLTEGQVTAARRNPAAAIDRRKDIDSPNYFLDYAFEETKKKIEERAANGNNFVVRTTIDTTLQSYAEEAITSVIRDSGEQYRVEQGAMVVTDTEGAIRAMVGGTDYAKSQFNRSIVSNRQPGSAYKPFVYAEAMEQLGLKPSDRISDAPVCIGDWCPQNYGRSYRGQTTLISAFASSINTVPVTLSIKTGRDKIAELSYRMGLRQEYPVTRSLALGVASVSVLDMTSSYAVFANHGYKTPAYGLTRLIDSRGETVWEYDETVPRERVLSEQTVAYMNEMMRAVVTSGTGRRAHIDGVPTLGKTGTTTSYRDAWFAGFTGNYVAAVWFGNDDYRTTNDLTGGLLPTVAWQKFMAYAHTNIAIKPVFGIEFDLPETLIAAAPEETEEEIAQRPPNLKPAAASKLLDLAARLSSSQSSDQLATAPSADSQPTL
ncbi:MULTISPECIES: PBP1A family penicillin-binding protein [unclassified Devosia]|uniref:transglycosylase domain-containing protein n=1 Tax=unclassified Devosia TaxID=196773 RepID=UPI00145D0812|nr:MULTISPECIES: PBP1A family penicillin-binding protein [unclassified Devosia]MBJ6987303.1 PBP1A family penicillin-binding protein [Devosia sp. MC521]QMW63481.1 PBP1A family penicillin-binding protein [Devosia sp. MC521]